MGTGSGASSPESMRLRIHSAIGDSRASCESRISLACAMPYRSAATECTSRAASG